MRGLMPLKSYFFVHSALIVCKWLKQEGRRGGRKERKEEGGREGERKEKRERRRDL